jgi:hypothetical protein
LEWAYEECCGGRQDMRNEQKAHGNEEWAKGMVGLRKGMSYAMTAVAAMAASESHNIGLV